MICEEGTLSNINEKCSDTCPFMELSNVASNLAISVNDCSEDTKCFEKIGLYNKIITCNNDTLVSESSASFDEHCGGGKISGNGKLCIPATNSKIKFHQCYNNRRYIFDKMNLFFLLDFLLVQTQK